MATTTNFGWETPDDTDLVKDGALAMRTLGNAIDTSLVDLKGGTTGQVLSKTSNTDMDFTWVTSDDANAIQNAIVDAKGDLIAASAADTPARLAVGNNGETLVADSSASTGLRWQATPSASNPIINSGMDIWQRGTSVAASGSQFGPDRWNSYRGSFASGITVSRQDVADTTNLPFIQYCARIQRDSGNTGTQNMAFNYNMENVDSTRFIGQTITLSFYARLGANYSASSNLLNANVTSGTGTDQALRNGFTGSSNVINTTVTLTSTWQRFTLSGTVGATAKQLGISFAYTPVGTAGAADFYEITGVQLDVGSVALPYRRYCATLAGELQAAQRYYQRFTCGGAAGRLVMGMNDATTTSALMMNLPVTMRSTPPTLDFGNVQITEPGNNNFALTGLTVSSLSTNTQMHLAATGLTGLTQYRPCYLTGTGSTSYIAFSAEL